ncbi:MAG: TolC family protein [Planctomycetes bacterium]|nr:TolC family protein [Planctomycetota bacterium]
MVASRAGCFVLVALACLTASVVSGCSPSHYKAQADRDVYGAIDRQWQDECGPREGYHVPDVDPSVHQLAPARAYPAPGVVTLAEALVLALDHNRLFQMEKELLYLTGLNETLIAYQFAPHPLGSVTGFVRRDRVTGVPDRTDAGAEAALFYQQVFSTGATITADLLSSWTQVLSGERSGGFATLGNVAFVQPLLRGLGSDIVLEPWRQAQRDTLYQVRTFNRARQVLAAQVMAEYYQVLELEAVVRHAQANYEAMTAHVKRMDDLAKAGRVTDYEILEARQDRTDAHNELLEARQEYETLLDLFKQTIGIPITTDIRLDADELNAHWSLDLLNLEQPEAGAIELALARRLDLANQRDRIDDADRHIKVTADALGPGLSIVATGGLATSSRDNNFGASGVDDTFTLGLRFDAPLDRLLERNAYRTALLELVQRRREYEDGVQLASMEVRQALRDLLTAAERRRILEEQLAPAIERLRSAESLLQYGRADARDVLDAQQDLFDLQVEIADTRTDYAVAAVNLYRDTGVLDVQKNGQCDALQRRSPAPHDAGDPAGGDGAGDGDLPG